MQYDSGIITDVLGVGSPDLRVSGSSGNEVNVISMNYIENISILKIGIQHNIFLYDCVNKITLCNTATRQLINVHMLYAWSL